MYLLLVNPEAGNQRFRRVEKPMRQLLDKLKIPYTLVPINDLADVTELVNQHLRPTCMGVVAVGGNGTVDAVINALVGRDVPLGIIPLSRTNHLAYSLGIRTWQQGVKLLNQPVLRAERLGQIGKHYFVGKVEIASRDNFVAKYVRRTSPWLKFLGLHSGQTANSGVDTKLVLDDEIQATGPAHKVEVMTHDQADAKKLRIRFFAAQPTAATPSLLHSDKLTIESDTKMPVMMGNETIAHTPVEVRGLTKHIQLIVPKSEKLTTPTKP